MEIHTRSYLLVQQEIIALQENIKNIQIVNVELPTSALCLLFPSDGIWKGGQFYFLITFPEDFHFSAPKLRFMTIPFHPNIDPVNGDCCLPKLEKWTPTSRITDVIQDLLELLNIPDHHPRNVLNKEARDVFTSSSELYSAVAQQCSKNSVAIGEVLEKRNFSERYDLRYSQDRPKAFIKPGDAILHSESGRTVSHKEIFRQVGFDEYYKMWNQIGTTKQSGKTRSGQQKSRLSSYKQTASTAINGVAFDEAEPTRVIRTALKMKLDTVLSPGRVPPSYFQLPSAPQPLVGSNTPIREEDSPIPMTKTIVFTAPSLPDSGNDSGKRSSIGVTMVQKNVLPAKKDTKDFKSQMPSLPPSQESKFRFRSDEPIFDQYPNNTPRLVTENEADTLLEWTQGLNNEIL